MEPVHFLKIGIDILVLIVTLIAWILIHIIIPIRKSGFKCDDYSINLPYKDSTVTNNMLIAICTLLPVVIICSTEFTRNFYSKYRHKNKYVYKIKMLKNSLINIPEVFGNIYVNLGSYIFGLLIVQFLTNLGKFTIGRLRPHYYDVCKPKFINFNTTLNRINCNQQQYFIYEVDYICENVTTKRFREAHLSFPSGHSSTVFYTMIFLILYIKYTWSNRKMGLLIPFIQIILFSIAFFTGLSRVVDHKHHSTDVLAGAILGIIFAILTFVYLTDFVKKKNFSSTSDNLNTGNFSRSNSRCFTGSTNNNNNNNNNNNTNSSNNNVTSVFIENL